LKYWKPETVADSLPTLSFSASNQSGKIRPGDVLWIVTSEGPEDLVLVGRQKVQRVVGRDEARKILRTARLWPADFYAISDEPEDKFPIDISRHAYDLSFDGGVTRSHFKTGDQRSAADSISRNALASGSFGAF
jgi:hypothetical protein